MKRRIIEYKGKRYKAVPEKNICEGCAFRTRSGGCSIGPGVDSKLGISCYEEAVIFVESKNERRKTWQR